MRERPSTRGLPEALLAVLVVGVYARVAGYAFVFDDANFFDATSPIHRGLTLEGLRWSLTSTVTSSWCPLTMLSHMLDVQLFGIEPRSHHLVNVLLHCLNTLLLFRVFAAMTGARWRSFLVAALFALHPLQVESVAWVAARMNLLSTLFGFAALAAYLRYVRRPGVGRHLLVVWCLALSLLSKSMLVTLPFLLLLLDYWPLGRLAGWRPWLEKAPLLALSVAAGTATYVVSKGTGAMSMAHRYPPAVRVANAAYSYLGYIGKTLWPSDLGVLYQHPGSSLPTGMALLAGATILFVTVPAVLLRRRFPFFTVGWLWFLGTLVPVIGLVQVGEQAMADRYAYVPIVGLFIAAAWGANRLSAWRRPYRAAAVLAFAAAVAALLLVTTRQLPHWRDNRSLYEQALAVNPGAWMMHADLAGELMAAGELAKALDHQRAVVRLRPDLSEARFNLALSLDAVGLLEEAVERYRETLQINPHNPQADLCLGKDLLKLGRTREAVDHLARAARIRPGDVNVRMQIGAASALLGNFREAAEAYRQALILQPQNAQARQALAALPPLLKE